jgi:hypothetical protein
MAARTQKPPEKKKAEQVVRQRKEVNPRAMEDEEEDEEPPFGVNSLNSDLVEEDAPDGYLNRLSHGGGGSWLGNMLPLGGGRRLMAVAEEVRWFNVTESVYYATLNHTSPTLVRLMAHTIVQRCTLNGCHPHFNSHPKSSKALPGIVIYF